MKILRIIFVSLLIVVLMAIIAGGIFVRYSARKALPDYNADIHIRDLQDTVIVYRDSTAMPHVYAKSEYDLYRAAGYITAQDRIWQMDVVRRLTQGRLTEIFGEDLLETDRLFRTLNLSKKSDELLEGLDKHLLDIMQAYSDGVNQYLDDNRGKLPPEFAVLGYEPDKWKPSHSANLIGYMSWNLSVAWSVEAKLFRLSQKLDEDYMNDLVPGMNVHRTFIHEGQKETLEAINYLERVNQKINELGLTVFQASNNWAVAGWKSKSGNAMLANDMHLELNMPGIWYQMHQVIPGELNVSGLVLPGAPFIICGHNDSVAWGMTNVMLDDLDFYLETIHPDDSTLYLLDGKWKKLKYKTEIIKTGEEDSVSFINSFTHRGPVVSDFKRISDKVISMRWTGMGYSNELRSVYLFNRMKNWEEFREASRSFLSVSQNIAYADKRGNIGMQTAAGIPMRPNPGRFIFPGDTSGSDWSGIVPFEELPYTYNPEEGFVASANNRVAGDDYPHYISRWFALPNRIDRIVEMLDVEGKLGMADMADIQSDLISKWAQKLVPFFTENAETMSDQLSDRTRLAISLLKTWDYKMSKNSVEATIFEQLYFEFLNLLFRDEMGDEMFSLFLGSNLLASNVVARLVETGESVWIDNVKTPEKKETAADLIIMAFGNTMDALGTRLGEDVETWQWGRVHQLVLNHPLGRVDFLNRLFELNKGPFPVGGSYHTVSPFYYSMSRRFISAFGASHRHIYNTGNWDESLIVLPTGISGIPASDYYGSQVEKFLDFSYNDEIFSDEMVRLKKAWKMKFIPGESGKGD